MPIAQEALYGNQDVIYPFAGYNVLTATSISHDTILESTSDTKGVWLLYVDTSTLSLTIKLPAPANCFEGQSYHFVDNTGSFAANNLTIDGNGALINGAATLVLSTNYASIQLRYNGTSWIIFTKAP